LLHAIRSKLLWLVLLALAGFVFFIQFVADVGGNAQPIPKPYPPPPTSTPAPSPVVEIVPPDWQDAPFEVRESPHLDRQPDF